MIKHKTLEELKYKLQQTTPNVVRFMHHTGYTLDFQHHYKRCSKHIKGFNFENAIEEFWENKELDIAIKIKKKELGWLDEDTTN